MPITSLGRNVFLDSTKLSLSPRASYAVKTVSNTASKTTLNEEDKSGKIEKRRQPKTAGAGHIFFPLEVFCISPLLPALRILWSNYAILLGLPGWTIWSSIQSHLPGWTGRSYCSWYWCDAIRKYSAINHASLLRHFANVSKLPAFVGATDARFYYESEKGNIRKGYVQLITKGNDVIPNPHHLSTGWFLLD